MKTVHTGAPQMKLLALLVVMIAMLTACTSNETPGVSSSSTSNTTAAPPSSSANGTSTEEYCRHISEFSTAAKAASAQFDTGNVSGVSKFAGQASVAANNIAATGSAPSFWSAVGRIENGYSDTYDYDNPQKRQRAYQATAADSAAIARELSAVINDAKSKCNVDLNTVDWDAIATYVEG